jgi:hypothetical protein
VREYRRQASPRKTNQNHAALCAGAFALHESGTLVGGGELRRTVVAGRIPGDMDELVCWHLTAPVGSAFHIPTVGQLGL